MDYLLKVSAVVAIFYLSYKLLLQRNTFFNENRWFLLMGLVTAFIIPLLVIPVYIEYTPVVTSEYISSDVVVLNEIIDKPFNILDYLPILYGLGVLFFLVKFLIQLMSLSFVIFKNKKEKVGRFTFINTIKNSSPFSFFCWIIINPNNFTKSELEQVMIHEKVHASQLHSIDVLLNQISCIVLWFNPFMWLYRKDVQQNLEFIADKKTQEKIDCKKSYQTTLLKASVGVNHLTLSNNFYNSLIKNRIIMLNKSKSKKINLFKFAVVIPLLALFLMNFNKKEVFVKKVSQESVNYSDSGIKETKDRIEVIIDKNTSDEDLNNAKEAFTKKFAVDFSYTNLKRDSNYKLTSIEVKLEDRNGAVTAKHFDELGIKPFIIYYNKDGSAGTHFVEKEKTNKVEEFVITDNTPDEQFNVLKELLAQKGYTLKISNLKRTKGGLIRAITINIKNETTKASFKTSSALPIKVIQILLDKENNSIKIGNLSKTDKEMVSGFSSQKAANEYNESKKVKNLIPEDQLNSALYILDGKEVTPEVIKDLNSDDINSMSVLKDEKATVVYGEKGKNGVILITSKEAHENKKFSNIGKSFSDVNAIEDAGSDVNVIEYARKERKEPLCLIDGKVASKKELKVLSPDDIESVSVLKNEKSIEKYGEKGKNGVIEITTKEKK
ncbi:M56 family metallopeptidase [Polaribacter sejongensis]|nr:M56 family metallopeptidase [Polaribacter sejongensis]